MQIIKISNSRSSGLCEDFNVLNSLEINDTYVEGGFGKVYTCDKINGATLLNRLAIKIYTEDGSGSARRAHETILKLQQQISFYNAHLIKTGQPSLQKINALAALPQFSFEATYKGQQVFGYAANYLDEPEWMQFCNIFNEPDVLKKKEWRNKFYNLPVQRRLQMAFDLVEGFFHLEHMKFIYADLNPKNIFVNLAKSKLCLIDYESGAINDNPETYGKQGEWLAPEILKQLSGEANIIKVDINTDTWAVAIGIHFMLFPFHPLFFLSVRGDQEMKAYLQDFKWPDIDINNHNFNKPEKNSYDWYLKKLNTEVHATICKAFSETINAGYFNPSRRFSYLQWKKIFKELMAPPEIIYFSTDKKISINGAPVKLQWLVENHDTLTIDNGVGDVADRVEITVKPKTDKQYKLTATNRFGEVSRATDVSVFPIPSMEAVKIPTAELDHALRIPDIIIQHPPIVPLLPFDSSKITGTPAVPDLKIDLKDVKPLYRMDQPAFSVSAMFEIIKNKINKTIGNL